GYILYTVVRLLSPDCIRGVAVVGQSGLVNFLQRMESGSIAFRASIQKQHHIMFPISAAGSRRWWHVSMRLPYILAPVIRLFSIEFTFIDQKLKPAHLHSVTSDESTHLDHHITASSLLKHFIAVSPRAYELTIRVIGASVTIDPPGKHLKLARNQYQHSPPRQHHLRFVQVDNIPPIRRSAPRPRTYNTK
ncbi:hypothetical protein FOXYSP1_11394, partial [Fusarium oxysporum f. sp. phaseoli]